MTSFSPLHRARSVRAFTLVELLVATVVLLIILLMLVAMVNQTSTIWRTSSAKVEQFRAARTAFDSINRNLSQATLNTYFDYQLDPVSGKPVRYIRQSDLRFLVAGTKEIFGFAPPGGDNKKPVAGPGHSVFFMAPLGFTSGDDETANVSGVNQYAGLSNLLNTWGYFVEYGTDYNFRPPFLNNTGGTFTSPPERYRYRLMEFMVPSDHVRIYQNTSVGTNSSYKGVTGITWFSDFLKLDTKPSSTSSHQQFTDEKRPVHLLAENIIGLTILPQLSAKDQATVATAGGAPLAPGYTYDSSYDPLPPGSTPNPTTNVNSRTDPHNQLPPVVQVTMIAMDETSGARVEANTDRKSKLDTSLQNYFQASSISSPQSGANSQYYARDLKKLQEDLVGQQITYRTFTTSISLRAAKWSQD